MNGLEGLEEKPVPKRQTRRTMPIARKDVAGAGEGC